MAISYNDINVDTVVCNAAAVDTVTYNGTEVFQALTEYTFPNASAQMSSNTDYGIQIYVDNKNNPDQDGWRALDNNTATAWMQHASGNGRMCIVFPFPIRLQSVSIINKSTLYASTSATVNGLETGYIYVSSDVVDDPTGSDETMAAMDVYAELDRAQPSATADLMGYTTSHSNPDFAKKWIRSIAIKGTSWGAGGGSNWKTIGELSLVFRTATDNLVAAGLL